MIWYSLPEGILVYTVSAHHLNLHGDQTSGCNFILLCLFAGKMLDWLKWEEWSHDWTNQLRRQRRLRDRGRWVRHWTAGWAFLSLFQIRGLDFFSVLYFKCGSRPGWDWREIGREGMSESVCSAKIKQNNSLSRFSHVRALKRNSHMMFSKLTSFSYLRCSQ